MSGDTVAPDDHALNPTPLDLNMEAQENGAKINNGICVNSDRGSCGDNEIEMEGQDMIFNKNEGLSIKINGSLDSVNVEEANREDGDCIVFVAENGKDLNEISQNDPNEVDENEGEKEHEFCVGEFVWAKFGNKSWWPGRIYDPSDASDYAMKLQKSEKLLVAYFGAGSFSWCLPSQLKPFAENFAKMSNQNTSKNLTHAVEEALNEIGRIIEYKMSYSCISEENKSAFARPLAVNAGIRQGVLIPDYDLNEIIPLEPVKIISLVENYAIKGCFPCVLELTVLKSWLSTFYRVKNGKNKLAAFYEPHAIEGLEDKGKEGELNKPWLKKCEGIEADKLYKSRKRKSVAKIMKEDEVVEPITESGSKSRKRKMRAENEEQDSSREKLVLINGNKIENEFVIKKGCEKKVLSAKNDEGESQMVSENRDKMTVIEKVDKISIGESENVASIRVKRVIRSSEKDQKGKSVDQARRDLASPLQTRKRKKNLNEITEKIESIKNECMNEITRIENDEQEESGNYKITKGENENVAASGENRKTRSLAKVLKGNSGQKISSQLQTTTSKKSDKLNIPEITEEKGIVKSERERKKSIYLSPPFVNFSLKTTRMGERLNRVAIQVIGSTPNSNNKNENLQNIISKKADNPSPQPSKEEGKEMIDEGMTIVGDQILISTPDLNNNDKLSQDNISNKIVTPSPRLSEEAEKKVIDAVQISISTKKVISEIRSRALNPVNIWDKELLKSVEGFIFAYRNVKYLTGSCYKIYQNAQKGENINSVKIGSQLVKANNKDTIEEASKPVSLIVIFPPGFCLPSKTDLIAIFKKFGLLNEMETDVSHECYCAKVVFVSYSDTEKAFEACLKENLFGSTKVSYRLRYSAGSSRANEIVKKADKLWGNSEFEGSCLLFLKQKLEIMTKMVDDCGGTMSSELMVKLQNEIKGLLDNICSVTKPSFG